MRHILFQPEITAEDIEANDARAESFSTRLEAGETMADLGLEPDTVELTLEEIARTSPALAAAMRGAQEGDVVGPVEMNDPRSENGWSLARVLGTTTGGVPEFSDFRDVIVER